MKKLLLTILMSFLAFQANVYASPTTPSKEALPLKLGYADMVYMLGALPDTQKVDSESRSYHNQLAKQFNKKMLVMKQKVEAFEKNHAKLSDVEQKKRRIELQQLSASIQEFEYDMQHKVNSKRQALLQPIYEKINDAIAKVAQEHGYTYIFGAGTGSPTLLYMPEDSNISDLVLAKLGVTKKKDANKKAKKSAPKSKK